MNRSRALMTGLALFATASALPFSGCTPAEADKPAEVTRAARVPVETITVQRKRFVRKLALPGRFTAGRVTRIAAEIPGRVIELPVSEGQLVKRDALLIRLDPTTARAQAQQAAAAVEQAQATVDLARTTARRMRRLAAAKVVDQARLDQAVGAERQTKAALRMARAASDLAQATVRKLTIRAPFDGRIARRDVELGEIVSPGPPLVTLSDYATMKLLVDVPERSVAAIRLGHEVDMTVMALSGRKLKGTVSRIPMEANSATRTFPVEVLVDNADGSLRSGMLARVEMILESLDDQVVVPLAGLVDEPGRGKDPATTVVFLVQAGKAKMVEVQSGAMQGDEALVLSGLRGGEQLVIIGQRRVVHDDLVEVVGKAEKPPGKRRTVGTSAAPTAAAAAPQ